MSQVLLPCWVHVLWSDLGSSRGNFQIRGVEVYQSEGDGHDYCCPLDHNDDNSKDGYYDSLIVALPLWSDTC